MRLEGKTALVTGASSGIGEAIALAFAHEGAQVVLSGRHAERGEAIVQTIREAGGTAHFITADLTSRRDIDQLVSETLRAVGRLDILVNNAGIFPMAPTAHFDEAAFDAIIATNLKAPFFLTAAFAPPMAERGWGKIINTTTVLAHKGASGASLYGATKAALTLLTRSWAAEFGPSGVNVNAIAPHLVRTPGIEQEMDMQVFDLQQLPPLPGVSYRSGRGGEDAAPYVALLHACQHTDAIDPFSTLEHLPTVEEMARSFATLDPEQVLVALAHEQMIGCVRTTCWEEEDGTWLFLHLGRIHPQWRGKGLGTAFVRWAEQRLRLVARAYPTNGKGIFSAIADSCFSCHLE